TRNRVSLTFPMPVAYKEKILNLPSVTQVVIAQWFGGTYIDEKNFFAQFAVEPEEHLELYPEYLLSDEEKNNFLKERNSCIVGATLAKKYGWQIGDSFRLIGTIFPGDWDFVIRGIYRGAEKGTDESTMFFHWKYLDERTRMNSPENAGWCNAFYVGIENSEDAVRIGEEIDTMFANSQAETLTETERAFRLGFVSMAGTIITALRVISFVVIAVILLVLANTMAMTARERISEYAILKTLGFRPKHLVGLIFGESALIAMFGGILGLAITIPMTWAFGVFLTQNLGSFFPAFEISSTTIVLAVIAAFIVGILAALFPIVRAIRIRIADGLRYVG
ncbi:FtsX-like permease family protein, partial [bacterium]|nr:FtsX-like permease family protein [bacterium]